MSATHTAAITPSSSQGLSRRRWAMARLGGTSSTRPTSAAAPAPGSFQRERSQNGTQQIQNNADNP